MSILLAVITFFLANNFHNIKTAYLFLSKIFSRIVISKDYIIIYYNCCLYSNKIEYIAKVSEIVTEIVNSSILSYKWNPPSLSWFAQFFLFSFEYSFIIAVTFVLDHTIPLYFQLS